MKKNCADNIVLIRGGGDLASGVAFRLFKSGLKVIITEIVQPLVVRRTVAFAEAVYEGVTTVEGITASLINDARQAFQVWGSGSIPVIIDPNLASLDKLMPDVLVDARMKKKAIVYDLKPQPVIIGLGPGFEVGVNCHAVVETRRGHTLGRVYWQGKAAENTGIPGEVMGIQADRVIRSPSSGYFEANSKIGDIVAAGQTVGNVNGTLVTASISGILRGLVHNGVEVNSGMKIGDIDPRMDPELCRTISDKALAVGGGVLEAILTVAKKTTI